MEGVYLAREKLTQEMVDLAIQYKGESCTNGGIICMLGVAVAPVQKWLLSRHALYQQPRTSLPLVLFAICITSPLLSEWRMGQV